ncbi:hypothetical protein C8R44DRAFT_623320, partial [Mycena epipterygia]
IAGFKLLESTGGRRCKVIGIDASATPAETRAQVLRITNFAIKYGASMDAFITDPVYKGKSLAGMIYLIKRREISGGNVLYAHLGGQLALSIPVWTTLWKYNRCIASVDMEF